MAGSTGYIYKIARSHKTMDAAIRHFEDFIDMFNKEMETPGMVATQVNHSITKIDGEYFLMVTLIVHPR